MTAQNLEQIECLCNSVGGGRVDNDKKLTVNSSDNEILTREGSEVSSRVSESKTWTIAELAERLDIAITQQFNSSLWIVGEIQNLNLRRGGVTYFSLSEPVLDVSSGQSISINAIIWQQQVSEIKNKLKIKSLGDFLQDGLKVRFQCRVSFYRGRGQVSLVVVDIDPDYTKGQLSLERERLIKELRSKGLAEANKKTLLSSFPFRVGLISASNSRAETDFTDQLNTYGFCGEIFYIPCAMQGEKVPIDVVTAIKVLVQKECDLIVITRGGGSAADLRWFDTEQVALAIANSKVPIVAAIGHHDDVCIAEEVSFHREKTPTAAADFVIQCFADTNKRVEQLLHYLVTTLSYSFERREQNLSSQVHALSMTAAACLRKNEITLNKLSHRVQSNSLMLVSNCKEHISKIDKCIASKDPRQWLENGWTRLYNKSGVNVSSLSQVKRGDLLHARLKDGNIALVVKGDNNSNG